MSYIPLSLKYRPKNFDEIAGQEPIATTLKNAISLDKVAHAYLFSGPRGTGKTTTARVLAKALNCKDAPTTTPCNKCASCVEISEGRGLDVLEIDGASNRGIDEIRNLRENVKFAPALGDFKIYIIDEVHMLTAEAFNALLKTLEEPPPHVKFIFATTRKHKVLPTIASRCQQFDFKRLTVQDIIDNLKSVSEKEKINIKEEALFLIAKNADGSMRDAQVILDQLHAFNKSGIEAETVKELLGVVPQDAFFSLTDAIVSKDARGILKILDELIAGGKEALSIAAGLINHFRNMMVLKLTDDTSSIILSNEDMGRLEEQAKYFSVEDILYVIYSLTNAVDFIRKTPLARVPLEVALVRILHAGKIKPLAELLSKISNFEKSAFFGNEVVIKEKEENIPEPFIPPQQETLPMPEPDAEMLQKDAPEKESRSNDEGGAFQEIKSRWYEIMNCIKNKKMSVASFLIEANPVELKGNRLIIGFGKQAGFHKESLESEGNRKIIEGAISEIIKRIIEVEFVTVEYTPEEEAVLGSDSGSTGSQLTQPKKVEPIVESALDIFNGKVVKRDKQEK